VSARWQRLRESLRSGFWAVPTACVSLAVVLAVAFVAVDRRMQNDLAFTFGAGPDGAREVLSAITTAMITFTGLVFSITVVVLQLTSSQFSPRVLRTFLRDRLTQYALGVFTATFVYAVMVLRTVNGGDDEQFVPALSTTFAVALLLLSVALFVAYIHHVATTIQVSSIIAAIGDETRAAIERRFPSGRDEPADGGAALPPDDLPNAVVPARRSGVVLSVDEARLVEAAQAAGVVLRMGSRVGDFVPEGAPLVEVLGDAEALDLGAVTGAVGQGRDRTLQQDVRFGLRQLVDVGERALSTGVNDPTTAVQALDQLHDLLRRLVTRRLRTGLHTDDAGAVRLVVPPDGIEDYLALALDEIDQYGADAETVQQRMDTLLADVAAAALPVHRPALESRRAARAAR
jgi:uncharacterized membrane protein